MNICVTCKKEMRCFKNGVVALFGVSHGYSGDVFGCDCGNRVLVTGSVNAHVVSPLSREALKSSECLLEMED